MTDSTPHADKDGTQYTLRQEMTFRQAFFGLSRLTWEFANFLVARLLFVILQITWLALRPKDPPSED